MKLSELQAGTVVKPITPAGGQLKLSEIDPSRVQKPKPKPFRFAVPAEPTETREAKMARLNADAAASKAESDKANSFGGFVGNFGKAFVRNIAGSEVGLGETIAKISTDPNKRAEAIAPLQGQQATLIKQIREKDARGEDTTKLKRIFNSNADFLEKETGEIANYAAELPTTGKVAGQLLGTAFDVLSAGTYGKATAGMTSGVLGKAVAPAVAPVAATGVRGALGSAATAIKNVAPSAVKTVTPAGVARGILTLPGAGRVAAGAGLGYVTDVSQGLQGNRGEDREGAAAFIPGAGTIIGAAIPAALETEKTVIDAGRKYLTKEGREATLIANRQKELEKLDGINALKKVTEKGNERGIDIKKVLSETDVLHGAVDKTGKISTKGSDGAVAQYTKEFVDGNEALVSDALKKEARAISPGLVKKKLMTALENSGIEGADLIAAEKKIDSELLGYARRGVGSGGAIPLETLHNAKIDKYSNINFFSEGSSKKYDKTVAKALKELVEDNTTSIAVKEVNKELAKHFAVIDYLEKLDGKTVAGGKLGKYFAQTVGAIVGSHFGPVGAIAGAEAGGRIKGSIMSKTFTGKTGRVQEQAPAITAAKEFVNREPLRLPQSSNSSGSLKINQAPTTNAVSIPPITAIPRTVAPGGDTVQAAIGRHLTEAREVLTELPKEEIAKLGGLPALLERTKINIADGLKAEGMVEAANAIRTINTAALATLDDLAALVAKLTAK